MKDPLLTVLMPVHNAERFLAAAIESILNQTFTDFEFVIIDDGSTDGTASIVNSFVDSRIRFYANDGNMGITTTLNKGIELARTPLIARMDADDISLPNRLQRQYEFMLQQPDVALVATWTYDMNQQGTEFWPRPFELKAYYYNHYFTCWIYHPTVLFRKSIIQQIGGYTAPHAEDFDLWWRLMQEHRFIILPEYLVYYRETDQSLHRVTQRNKYEEAENQMVVRNLNAVNPNLSFSFEQIQCLRSVFDPIVQRGDISLIMDLLKKMDDLTASIANAKNINCNPTDVYNAGAAHKQQILRELLRQLPKRKSLELALRTNAWREYYPLVKGFFQKKTGM